MIGSGGRLLSADPCKVVNEDRRGGPVMPSSGHGLSVKMGTSVCSCHSDLDLAPNTCDWCAHGHSECYADLPTITHDCPPHTFEVF